MDPHSLTATEAFRFGDHVGGVTRDRDTGQLVGNNWGSRAFYRWTAGEPVTALSPAGNVVTRNPFWVEAGGSSVRLSAVPDDDTSPELVYDSDPL